MQATEWRFHWQPIPAWASSSQAACGATSTCVLCLRGCVPSNPRSRTTWRPWKRPTAISTGLITTGHLPQQTAFDQGATGPIKRASGIERDLRRDHPYAAYDRFPMKIPMRMEGDAHARAQVRMEEIRNSIALVLEARGKPARGTGRH